MPVEFLSDEQAAAGRGLQAPLFAPRVHVARSRSIRLHTQIVLERAKRNRLHSCRVHIEPAEDNRPVNGRSRFITASKVAGKHISIVRTLLGVTVVSPSKSRILGRARIAAPWARMEKLQAVIRKRARSRSVYRGQASSAHRMIGWVMQKVRNLTNRLARIFGERQEL